MLAWIPLLAGFGCGGPDLPQPIELAYDGQRVRVDGEDLIAWPDCGHTGCGGDLREALEARRSDRPADDPLLSLVRVRVAPEVPYSALAGLLEASLASGFDRVRLEAGSEGVAWPLAYGVGYAANASNDGWLRNRGLTAVIVAPEGKVTAALARDGHAVGDVAGACVGPRVVAGEAGAWKPHLEATLREHAGTEPVLVTVGDDVPAGALVVLLGPLSADAREIQLSIAPDELDLHCDTTVVGKAEVPPPPGPSTAIWSVGPHPGAVDAYLADCAAVLPGTSRTAGDIFSGVLPEEKVVEGSDECAYGEFAPNGEPDPYGCFDDYQECRKGCGETCSSCQSECAATCGTCKEACRGDRACERACAVERASCRDGCMSTRGACRESACLTSYLECPSVRRAEQFAKCDRCARAAELTAEAWRAGERDLAKLGAAHREIEGFCWKLCRGAAQDRYQLPP